MRRLGERERGAAIGAVLVEDEPAPGDGVHLGIGRDDAEADRLQGGHAGQVVELGSEDIPGARPVAQRLLGQHELQGPVRVVQNGLAGHPRRHGLAQVGGRVGHRQDAPRVFSGLEQAGDDARLEVTQRPRRGLQLVHGILDEGQPVAEPLPVGDHLVDGLLGQRQHQRPPFLARPGRVGPRGDLRQRRNRVAALDPADGGLADFQRRRDPCPGQAREHADPL